MSIEQNIESLVNAINEQTAAITAQTATMAKFLAAMSGATANATASDAAPAKEEKETNTRKPRGKAADKTAETAKKPEELEEPVDESEGQDDDDDLFGDDDAPEPVTIDQVKETMREFANTIGKADLAAMLKSKFKVGKLTDLPEAKYGEFFAMMTAALEQAAAA